MATTGKPWLLAAIVAGAAWAAGVCAAAKGQPRVFKSEV